MSEAGVAPAASLSARSVFDRLAACATSADRNFKLQAGLNVWIDIWQPVSRSFTVPRIGFTLLLGLTIIGGSAALAQPPQTPREGSPNARRAGGQLPKVGAMVPEITLYDAGGKEFSTTGLRGQYSVLVFGCLT